MLFTHLFYNNKKGRKEERLGFGVRSIDGESEKDNDIGGLVGIRRRRRSCGSGRKSIRGSESGGTTLRTRNTCVMRSCMTGIPAKPPQMMSRLRNAQSLRN